MTVAHMRRLTKRAYLKLLPKNYKKLVHEDLNENYNLFNPLTPMTPIWVYLAKISFLFLEGIIKKIPMTVAHMSR